MVKSYDDPVKQKAREKLRGFIARNLLSFRKPYQVKVICFPGAEIEGEEALEVKEVYDPLGIPRQNIVGLEYNSEKAERLKRANLGIEIVDSSDFDYFHTTDQTFDIVSLDYTSQQTDKTLKSLEVLTGRGLMKKYAVLCTNFSAKRESKDMQIRLFHKYTRFQLDENGILMDCTFDDSDRRLEELEKMLKEENHHEMSDIREAITYEIIRILELGELNLRRPKILSVHPYHNELLETMNEALEKAKQTEKYKKYKDVLVKAGIFTEEQYEKIHSNADNASFNSYKRVQMMGLIAYIEDYLKTKTGIDISWRDTAKGLATLLLQEEAKPYFATSMERYSYVSNKNALMLFDLFYLDQCQKYYDMLTEIISIDKSTGEIRWNPLRESIPRVLNKLGNLGEVIKKADTTKISERTYLGSSWKPPKRKENISKEEAVDLLKAGYSPAEIEAVYNGFTKMQLAALKAHYITMGKEI